MMSAGACLAIVVAKLAPRLLGDTPVMSTVLPLMAAERSEAISSPVVSQVYGAMSADVVCCESVVSV